MYIDITWKIALPALVGLLVVATIVVNSTAESRGAARSAAVDLVDCNIHDPYSQCFAGSLAYPAGDLFVAYYF
jgi:hypothetical protein